LVQPPHADADHCPGRGHCVDFGACVDQRHATKFL